MTDPRHSVLELLLEHYPGLLSVEEVIRELAAGSVSFAERDRIEVAVRELIGSGLANRLGAFVFASHAAASFRQLESL